MDRGARRNRKLRRPGATFAEAGRFAIASG